MGSSLSLFGLVVNSNITQLILKKNFTAGPIHTCIVYDDIITLKYSCNHRNVNLELYLQILHQDCQEYLHHFQPFHQRSSQLNLLHLRKLSRLLHLQQRVQQIHPRLAFKTFYKISNKESNN